MVKRTRKSLISFVLVLAMTLAFVPVIQASASTTIKLGDYVQMGTYYGEPILWRCVAFEKISGYDENGIPIIDSTDTVTEYQEGYLPLMLSDKIICIKPFDAKTSENGETGSHSRNFNRGNYGSNYWAESNMRLWLNSSASEGNIEWLCGNAPSEDYVEYGYNDYADEAGFLTNFTQTELNAVKEVTQKSFVSKPEYENGIYTTGTEGYEYSPNISEIMTNYDAAYAEYVTDKIFLPDIKQADEIYKNGDILGDDYYIGEPTAQCVANSEYIDSTLAVGSKWHCWLRTPRSDDSNGVRYIYSTNHVYIRSAYRGDSGVRPAFYISQDIVPEYGEGTEAVPYIIDRGTPISDIDTFSVSVQDGDIVVSNNSSDEAGGIALTAKYDENDNLIITTSTELDVSGKGQTVIGTTEENYKYKVFIWSDFSKINPLAMAYMSE